ncbi:MAG: branched chain amino acid aminotransferase, partial [Terriglobus roseus]|nr:branched chain amino acid aminotransferase [Terriglobus roseus]
YICDEAFFTGTAAEVTHLRSVDQILVGDGTMGPITTRIQTEYMNLVNGRVPDRFGWITPVRVGRTGMVGEPVNA